MPPGLEASGRFKATAKANWTNATHICTCEVDTGTGAVTLLRYIVGEDCGPMINPNVVEGQIAGGTVQGIGGALLEHIVYDDDGNPLASTFVDYLLPTATDVPVIEYVHVETPGPLPGGYKGVGEGGAIGAPPAVVNAVNDALSPFGVALTRLPLSPSSILEAIARRVSHDREARASPDGGPPRLALSCAVAARNARRGLERRSARHGPSCTAPVRNPTHPLTTIEEIEQAALEIFAERGFEDPTVEEIAAAAGISRRTFFRYFPTKADIPWGNFDALLRKMDAWFESAPDDKPMFDVIAEGILRFNRVHSEGTAAHRERMTLIMRTPALVANAALRHADYSAVIARYAARRLDEPPDALAPQLVAHIALGASSAAYSEWLRDERSDLVDLIDRAFAMVQFEPEAPNAPHAAPRRRRARSRRTER